MKIGIFDSGLGGLFIAKAIRKAMPQYEYVYLGDTKRVPYGNRSHETVLEFTKEGVEFLFKKENCALVILACNTASARALRKIQKQYLPKNFPDRKVLGVIIPIAEEVKGFRKIGVLATEGTVNSESFPREILKINPKAQIYQQAAPLLVPFIENGGDKFSDPVIKEYLRPLIKKNIQILILGCTHYPILKNNFKKMLPSHVKIISQDEIVPKKLKNYLIHHPEISTKLSKGRSARILVTDKTQTIDKLTQKWFGDKKPKLIKL